LRVPVLSAGRSKAKELVKTWISSQKTFPGDLLFCKAAAAFTLSAVENKVGLLDFQR
jgi:hypothetical protein